MGGKAAAAARAVKKRRRQKARGYAKAWAWYVVGKTGGGVTGRKGGGQGEGRQGRKAGGGGQVGGVGCCHFVCVFLLPTKHIYSVPL